jgi:hypothetical protein
VAENCNCKLYCDRSVITHRTIHNNRPEIVILDKTIKEAYLIDVAIANGQNLHSTITENLQKYRDLTEELIRIWQLQTACTVPPVLFTAGIIPNKLHDSLQLLDLLHVRCTKQQYLTHGVQSNVFGRTVNKKCWSVRPYCLDNQLNCREVRKGNDDNYYYYYYHHHHHHHHHLYY